MAQEPIEMILLKHWASYLALPVWLTDPDGSLVYYNEPAESILGRRFDDAGEIPADRLAEIFVTEDEEGRDLPASDLPLVRALTEGVPAHRVLRIRALDGSSRVIEVTAIPILGQGGRRLGAMATFWERG